MPMTPTPPGGLAVIDTHPVQYRAPLYRLLRQEFGVPVTAVYATDFSVVGYLDREFGTSFAWDTDLLGGYDSIFLGRVAAGGPASREDVGWMTWGDTLRRLNPAAVLVVAYDRPLFWQAIGRAWRRRCPILFRAETTDHARPRGRLKGLARDALLRAFYRRCAALLYVGQRSRQHYERLGCPDRDLIFSPYCVDTSPFRTGEGAREELRAACRDELGIGPGQTVLLVSGKLVPRKGPDLVLAAAEALPPEERGGTVLLFLGDGKLREQLARRAAAVPGLSARFVGFRNQRELSKYYHAADLLVMASRASETWGLVVNEALHHGLPCVTSDAVGCAPDLVLPGRTGETFASGSAAGLSAALRRAWSLSGRAEVRQRCREHAEGYSLRRAAAGVAEAYARVAPLVPALKEV
jgi:glycosyltransferase involved in cell wall biosynthesis